MPKLQDLTRDERVLAAAWLEQNASLLDDTDRIAFHRYGVHPTGEGASLRRVAAVLSDQEFPELLSFDITMTDGSRGTFQAPTEVVAQATAERRFPGERVAVCRQVA